MTTPGGTTHENKERDVWKGSSCDPQDVRLTAALLDARRRLTALKLKRGAEDQIAKVCGECLDRANQEASFARFIAWDCLHQFDDAMLAAMSDEERDARWCTLRHEAEEKLKGSWRGKAVECVINQAPKDKHVPLHLVRELQLHVATAAQNQQHKLDLFQQRSMPVLAAVLAFVVAAALVFSFFALNTGKLIAAVPWIANLAPWTATVEKLARALVVGIPAGALGGILSMAFTLGRADLKAKIPDMRLSRLVTFMRPLLGAAVAIPVIMFINAGFLKVAGFEGHVAIFAFSLLGGFSERWFLGVMERFETAKK